MVSGIYYQYVSVNSVIITDSHNLSHQATYIITSSNFGTKPLLGDLVWSSFFYRSNYLLFLGIKVDLFILYGNLWENVK